MISAYFKRFGRVKDVKLKKKIAKDQKARVNCGYCLVEFYDQKATIQILEKKTHEIEGRLVTCRPFLKGSSLKKKNNNKEKLTIYLSNLQKHTTNEDLYRSFARFGSIDNARTVFQPTTGFCRGFGFITYEA